MENKACVLRFSHWDSFVSIGKDHSDISLDEYFEMARDVALAAGFLPEQVNEYFNGD